MMEKNGAEIMSGADNRFNDLTKSYERIIELLTKQKQSGEMSILTTDEQAELDSLSAQLSSKDHDSQARYINSLQPEQHKKLQNLEAKIHELRGE